MSKPTMTTTLPTPAASNEPPQEVNHTFSSLPKDIVLRCLHHVPKNDLFNISCVSKTLRSLVRSPEFYRMRYFLPKDTVYLCCHYQKSCRWLTLCRSKKKNKKKKTIIEYHLVQALFPCDDVMYFSSNVTVGSKIYFIGRSFVSTSDLWILDTRSGELTQGPSMKLLRTRPVVGVIDGKIYVLGGRGEEETKVEVFDLKLQQWGFAGEEKVRCRSSLTVTLEKKIYLVEERRIFVYDPRKGGSKTELMEIQEDDGIGCMCVVDDVLYVYFVQRGIMWLDTKVNIWRRVLSRDGKTLDIKFPGTAMSEYDGKLAVFLRGNEVDPVVKCVLFALVRVGENIYGTQEWSGVVATIPYSFYFVDCLTVSQ